MIDTKNVILLLLSFGFYAFIELVSAITVSIEASKNKNYLTLDVTLNQLYLISLAVSIISFTMILIKLCVTQAQAN